MTLRLDGVAKAFFQANGKAAGVCDLNFSVAKGEGFSLLGPSGCGKTTTLRLIGGFETPDSGKIWLDQRDITHLAPQQRPIRTVFQRYALFPHLNVWENVIFGLRMQKLPEKEIKSRGHKIIEMIEITHLLDRPIAKLSGGEQQRVALARALITEPEILLLDEPFSALDLKLRERLQLELLALKRKLGATFIFVTHDQNEAMLLSDRIAVMRQGIIEQIASPEDLYWRPTNKFVASFIGQANFFCQETIAASSGAKSQLSPLRVGQEWMVRAERLRVMPASYQTQGQELALKVNVLDQVFRGQERLYRVTHKERQFLIVSAGKEKATANVGDSAQIVWNGEDSWAVTSTS